MTDSRDSKQKITAIAAVVGVLLLGLIAFLLYNKVSQDKQITAQAMEIEEVNRLKTDLEKNYYEALSDLEEMKGDNEELNALIEGQKEELKASKEKVDKILRTNRANKRELANVREQITALSAQRDQYLTEINALKAQNEQLTSTNTVLTNEKIALTEEVGNERVKNQNLTAEKVVLVSEKEELEVIKEDLTTKVDFASVVKLADVSATGWKMKKSGKPVMKTYAKNIDQMKICFTPKPNKLAGMGKEMFLVRVINPVGETMAIEELGSGVFTNTKTGEEIRYTQSKEIDYPSEDGKGFTCLNWTPNVPFQKGIYEIEVYNEGYLAGTGKCTFK